MKGWILRHWFPGVVAYLRMVGQFNDYPSAAARDLLREYNLEL